MSGKMGFLKSHDKNLSGDWYFVIFQISTFLFVYQAIMDFFRMGFQ